MDTALILGLAGLGTTLVGSLGAPQLASRSQRAVIRLDDRRAILDEAAVRSAACEATARAAWRELLELEVHAFCDDILGEYSDFPKTPTNEGKAAVLAFATMVEDLPTMESRLALRLGEAHQAVQAFSSVHKHLAQVATDMRFAMTGRGDFDQCVDEFFNASDARAEFLRQARTLV